MALAEQLGRSYWQDNFATSWPNLKRTAAIGLVAAIHLVLILAFLSIRPSTYVARVSEIQVSVFHPHMLLQTPPPPPIHWALSAPEDVEVPEPQIFVLPDPNEPSAITSADNQILPPRPDPSHANPAPEPPPGLGKTAAGASIILALDVLPDGSIAEARVEKTSGHKDVDEIAMIYVKDNWRFLPAYRGGQPIEGWIYVQVRFAAG